MRMAFTATEVDFDDDDSALICSVASDEHYLTFQLDSEDPDDWGIYLEYDDQGNGHYGCIAGCRLTRDYLGMDLAYQLGGLAEVTGFDVTLNIDPESFDLLKGGLVKVFQGHADILHVE